MTDNSPQAFIIYDGNGVTLEYTNLPDPLYPLIRDSRVEINGRSIVANNFDQHRGWVQFQHDDAVIAAALHAMAYHAVTYKFPDGHNLPLHIKTVDAPLGITEDELNSYIDSVLAPP